MRILLIIFLCLLPVYSFAEIKTITKTSKVVVPENQSVEQVKQYTSEKLFREAAEEAGVAVSSSTVLVDGKVSKDEIKMQTSAIAKKDVKILNQEIDKGLTYITVQVTATVDSSELDAFLRQLMQNEALKQELEKERKEKLELEKRLKSASKEEYDSTLSAQAENIAKIRAARQKQLETEISNAKQQLMEAQRRQKAEELQAAKELEQIQKEYMARDAALQERIAAEKDAQAKAEMEHQALLAELSQNAFVNDKAMDISSNDTVEMAAIDAARVRVNFAALVKEFNTAINANSKQMEIYHKSQLLVLEKQKFTEKMPKKGEWDNTTTYNAKIAAYNKRRQAFEDKKQTDIAILKAEYENKTEKNIKESKQTLLNALSPLYERLKKYNTGDYISSDTSKAVIDFGERDLDRLELPVIIKYQFKTYDFIYTFTSLQEFRAMYETRASFRAVPVYALEPNGVKGAKQYLKGFRVVHLGNNQEKFFAVDAKYEIFPEIKQYEDMQEELKPKQKEEDKKENDYVLSNNKEKVYKAPTSDTVKIMDNTYKTSYWLYGFAGAGGFDLNIMNIEFGVQTHWRFNRWFGIYTNGSLLLGISGLNTLNNLKDNYDDYYIHSSGSNSSTLDTGLALGLGLDFYLTNRVLLFGEANAAYYIEDDSKKSSFAGVIRGGLAFQSEDMRGIGMRFNIFIEGIISDTVSGSTPYFGAALYF
ncbi:MAG TPA: hypothetical protein H9804_06865 [Candidatus Mucispirillum faecigallinarum]|uniref:Uncharacterized protein n=1 Tax=Candidatus Mucispirillum faecigallinarum TaxID=2838699 RepID=A0A9D2KD45_9BACT|nr:hypothetical protein [Candidatus Mucispirillum faecigallinarum]